SEGSVKKNGRALVWIVVTVSNANALVCTLKRYQSLSCGLSIVSVESPNAATNTLATMCLRSALVESLEFKKLESAKKHRSFSSNRSGPMRESVWKYPFSAISE